MLPSTWPAPALHHPPAGALVERGIAQRYASAAGPRKAAALRRLIAALGKGVLKAAAGSNGYGAVGAVGGS